MSDTISTSSSPRPEEKIECQCCYDDVLSSLTISCQSSNTHAFCFECIRNVASTQIGYMRYKIQCMHDSGCEGTFLRSQLMTALGPKVLNKLESIQQEFEIQEAGLDGLESCPFCDFKAVYPPVKDEPVFHCLKESCKKPSCRSCRENDHAPLTCHEVRLKHGSRHRVEEAMSDVLIRRCPNPHCKVAIVKVSGCNKVQCTKCRRYMCFVCSKDITTDQYNHFSVENSCPTTDWAFLTQEYVRQAESITIAQILQELPHLKEDDLKVDKPMPVRTRTVTRTGGARRQVTHFPGLPPWDIHDELGRPLSPGLIAGFQEAVDNYHNMTRHPPGAAIEGNAMGPNPLMSTVPGPPYGMPPLDARRPEPQPRPQPNQNQSRLESPGQQRNENNPLYLPRLPRQYRPDALTERRSTRENPLSPARRQPQNHPGAQVQPTGENKPLFSGNPRPRNLPDPMRAQHGERNILLQNTIPQQVQGCILSLLCVSCLAYLALLVQAMWEVDVPLCGISG